jgi:methylenetetrahydrofolate reductase (NADPH)
MTSDTLAASLRQPRYEVVPMKGIDDQLPYLPPEATVTITVSPSRGPDPTLELAAQVRERGHRVVPHLSARTFTSRQHVERALEQLERLAIDEVFVVGGDPPEPLGPYEGAVELLETFDDLGHRFRDVGIAGYPEAHPTIPEETVVQALKRKAPYATYVTSQICYDAATIRSWIANIRDLDIDLPVHLGIPGVVDRTRLLRISTRVGLGDSIRFLRKQSKVATRLASGYRPDGLMLELTDLLGHDDGIAGWHINTFNEIERTETWRQELLDT